MNAPMHSTILLHPRPVLDFWFSTRARPLWFEKDQGFDDEIRSRFGCAVGQAQSGGFQDWRRNAEGSLGRLILLDQMARNVHRGSPLAYAGDARALDVAQRAIEVGFDRGFNFDRRRFFYLPFEHSEDPAIQERSLALFGDLASTCEEHERRDAEEQLRYARRHAEIIGRFGRYPHRNACLGRGCSPDELACLTEPDSSF